jgi:hypothetical protein
MSDQDQCEPPDRLAPSGSIPFRFSDVILTRDVPSITFHAGRSPPRSAILERAPGAWRPFLHSEQTMDRLRLEDVAYLLP